VGKQNSITMITIVFLSFHSEHHIRRLLKKLGGFYPIIIIENSRNFYLKNELEKKYKNLRVIIPRKNLGYSKGLNLGFKLSKTNFVFINPADVEITKKTLLKLDQLIKKYNDFALLGLSYYEEGHYKSYNIYKNSKNNFGENNKNILKKLGLLEVDDIDCTILINKKKVSKLFDENIFIYFEVNDLAYRYKKKGEKILISKNIKFRHYGQKSHNEKFDFEAKLSRCWHYNWSKFYFFKKHWGYFFALKKTFPNLKNSFIKLIICCIKFDKNLSKMHFAELSGLLSSILNRKSSYRPYEKYL